MGWAQPVATDNPPAPATPAAVSTSPSTMNPASTSQPSASRWRLPPVLVGGSIGYDSRRESAQGEPQRRFDLMTLNLHANTFIYQPWLATLNAKLGLTQAHNKVDQSSVDDRFTTGGLQLNLFPRSRFPAELRYEVSDSRSGNDLDIGQDYTSRLLSLTQRYRPVNGEIQLSGSYERRSQSGAQLGTDVQQALLGEMTGRWKNHGLSVSASHNLNERRPTSEEASFSAASARHTYSQGDALSVESGVNWARAEEQLNSGDNQTELIQASSLAVWRPVGKPYTFNASLRAFALNSANGTSNETLSAGVGGSYDFSPNFRLGANTAITWQDGESRSAWTGTIIANYQGPSRRLGEWSYDWFTGASLTGARNGARNDQSINTQIGHTASRQWEDPFGYTLRVSATQSLNLGYLRSSGLPEDSTGLAPDRGLNRSIQNSGSISWGRATANGSGFARLSLSDSRQLDSDRSRFQLVNFQMSGNLETSRYSGWAGDLTVQRVFQRSQDQVAPSAFADPFGFDRQISHSASGEVSWRHGYAFGIPRLRFTTRLRLSGDSQRSALSAVTDNETASWENRLDYQVGRLDSGIALRISDVDGQRRRTLTLRVQRNFGE